jgi:FAD/FMN-containing dehydrogenase
LCSVHQKDRQVPINEDRNGELVPFTRLNPAPDLYEREIERLVLKDLETFSAKPLFPVARQAHILGGGVPDILALNTTGRVVVIEVKRDVDRNHLVQCLEYEGWARLTNLDEVAGLYDVGVTEHIGVEAFFKGWQDFTETTTQRTIQSQLRLILIAREAGGRIYFAKDARLSPEKMRTMHPHLDDFLAVKNRADPEHRLESNLARCLQHTGR